MASDRNTLLMALLVPVLMIAALVLVTIVWWATGPLIALLVLAVVASIGVKVGTDLQRRSRFGDR